MVHEVREVGVTEHGLDIVSQLDGLLRIPEGSLELAGPRRDARECVEDGVPFPGQYRLKGIDDVECLLNMVWILVSSMRTSHSRCSASRIGLKLCQFDVPNAIDEVVDALIVHPCTRHHRR